MSDDGNYRPSAAVQYAHNIPHLNSHLQTETNQFSFTLDYVESLLPFPMLTLAILLLFVLFFVIFIFCRCCVNTCIFVCARKNKDDIEIDDSASSAAVLRSDRGAKILHYALISTLVVLFVVDFFLFLGSAELTAALANFSNAANIILAAFNAVLAATSAILSDSSQLSSLLVSSVCSGLPSSTTSQVTNELNTISSSSNSINSLSDPVNNSVNSFTNAITDYSSQKKNEIVLVIFFAVLFAVISYGTGLYTRKKFVFQISIAFTWFVVTGTFIICCLVMVIVVCFIFPLLFSGSFIR